MAGKAEVEDIKRTFVDDSEGCSAQIRRKSWLCSRPLQFNAQQDPCSLSGFYLL